MFIKKYVKTKRNEKTMNGNEDIKLHILIDYENMGSCGLIRSDILCTNDIVTIFYDFSKVSTERQYMNAVERDRGCRTYRVIKEAIYLT